MLVTFMPLFHHLLALAHALGQRDQRRRCLDQAMQKRRLGLGRLDVHHFGIDHFGLCGLGFGQITQRVRALGRRPRRVGALVAAQGGEQHRHQDRGVDHPVGQPRELHLARACMGAGPQLLAAAMTRAVAILAPTSRAASKIVCSCVSSS